MHRDPIPAEGKQHQQMDSRNRQNHTCDSAQKSKSETLRERLPNQPRPRSAERTLDRHLRPARHTSGKQQVHHIRTDNQQDHRTHGEQNLQAFAVLVPQCANPGCAARDFDALLRKLLFQFRPMIRHHVGIGNEPMPQQGGQFR